MKKLVDMIEKINKLKKAMPEAETDFEEIARFLNAAQKQHSIYLENKKRAHSFEIDIAS